MVGTLTHRVSLLSIVRQQIEIVLCQFVEVAARHAAAGADNAALTPFVAQLHQVSGALRMVQFQGAARFCSEIETALRAALRGTPADKAEVGIAARAAGRLREFVNDVAGGGADTPLQLFALYRELAGVGGNDAASEKDLFFPPVQDNAPAHANPRAITPGVLPVLVKDLRSRYQRGLIGWLKESAKPDGLKQMRDVLDALHQIAAQLPEPRGLWWAATILIEGVIELLAEPQAAEWVARVKPVCSRIDFLLRDLVANAQADTAPAQRDVYYAIASCRQATPRLREAQQLLNLESIIPGAPSAAGAAQSHQPLLDDARVRLENIKDVWTEYIAGEPKRLGRYRELLVPLTQKAHELDNLPLLQLLLAIKAATPQLPDPYPLDGQVMSLEMASALLMAENIIHHFNKLPSDLEEQVTIMKGWLAAAVEGKVATSTPAGLRADIVQKANNEKLRIATAREILKSLQQVEKAVEAYANDMSRRATLEPLAGTLRQVRGVFEVSNQKRAARLAMACQHLIERCASASTTEPHRYIEWLAEGLGSLGFYLEPCLHGKEPAERAVNLFFTRYENQPGFEALLERSQPIPVAQPEAALAAPAPVAAATALPVPAPAGAGREMLEIFLEEASEVLTTMESSIAQARHRADDQDALINVRRAFHTLKGSARMVGLPAFGDCAWDLEQVMNHWLAQALPATPQLLDLATDARGMLAEWAHALQGEETPAIDATDIARRARALRGEAPKVVEAAQTKEPGAIAASAPLPAASPAADTDPRNAVTLVAMPAGTPEQVQPASFMTMDFAAASKASAGVQAPTLDAGAAEQGFMTVMMPAHTPPARTAPAAAGTQASAPAYEPTLTDLGDRLAWLNGLVEEIQQQTSTGSSGAVNARLNEIMQMMGESMSEVIALHQRLQQQLDARKK